MSPNVTFQLQHAVMTVVPPEGLSKHDGYFVQGVLPGLALHQWCQKGMLSNELKCCFSRESGEGEEFLHMQNALPISALSIYRFSHVAATFCC